MGDVEGNEPSAEPEPDRGAEAEGESVDAEGATAFPIGEQPVDGRKHLRDHQRRSGTLHRARRHQFAA